MSFSRVDVTKNIDQLVSAMPTVLVTDIYSTISHGGSSEDPMSIEELELISQKLQEFAERLQEIRNKSIQLSERYREMTNQA